MCATEALRFDEVLEVQVEAAWSVGKLVFPFDNY
jgi:hypothetical protein